MQPIIFASGNPEKRAIAQQACDAANVPLECISLEIDEIQGEDPTIITRNKAERAFEVYGNPIVVSDDSWSIPALKGFPGPYMKSINHWFTPEDFLRLMDGISDRSVYIHQFLAYFDGVEYRLFSRDIPGVIAMEAHGKRGKAPIMNVVKLDVDEGKTLAEVFEQPEAALRRRYETRHDAWHDLVEWYKDKHAQK